MTRRRDEARVLVVGLGGLGCPAALALVDGGVRRLTLVDDDIVATSNLHRQILHRTADAGRPKVDSAAEALGDGFNKPNFPGLQIDKIQDRVAVGNVLGLIRNHDIVIDGTDHPITKFLLNDACVAAGVPLVHAGAVRWSGQVLAVVPGGPCLRCFFEAPPPAEGMSCAEQGVVGPVVGLVGALQAARALAVLDGDAAPGVLEVFDGLAGRLRRVRFSRAPECPACRRAGADLDKYQLFLESMDPQRMPEDVPDNLPKPVEVRAC